MHAFSHLRHSSAHDFICASSEKVSHAFAHEEHDSAQAVQIAVEHGPRLATICEAAEQTVAQSRQVVKVVK
jgi:hypothetical protein